MMWSKYGSFRVSFEPIVFIVCAIYRIVVVNFPGTPNGVFFGALLMALPTLLLRRTVERTVVVNFAVIVNFAL
jgi:hypothetical protein